MDKAKKKLLEQTHQTILRVGFENNDYELIADLISTNFVAFGTALDEKIFGIKDLKALLKRQKEQSRGFDINVELNTLHTHLSENENIAVFIDEGFLSVKTDEEPIEMVLRLSMVLEYIEDKWLMVHFHSSKPEEVESEKDTWGIENWKEKAEALEKEVAERTADLVLKNRDLAIEAALERVRARSMAMHSSDELNEVVAVLFENLKELQIPVTAAGIQVYLEDSEDMLNYVCGENSDGLVISHYRMPHFDNTIINDFKNARFSEKGFFVGNYSKKIKDSFYTYLFKNTEIKDVPEDIKQMIFDSEAYTISMAVVSNSLIAINDFQGNQLSENHVAIIKRFAKVFEQAYIRFLDLKKAEAQAQEAQIEAALERVRSRSMGMQKSEELEEIIQVVFDQFIQLGITVDHSGFIMDYKSRDDMNIWLADKHKISSQITLPYFDSPHWNSFNDAKEKGDNLFLNHLDFKEKNEFYKQIFKHVPDLSEEAKTFYLECPSLTIATTLAEDIGLYIENYSGIQYSEDDQKTLIRFGKVFQQTYTRFLDLKKAEAQAREAQIEGALEKVRSRTMAMQASSELPLAANNLFLQVQELGIPAWSAGYCIWQDDKYNANCNMSSEGEIQKGFVLPSIGEGYDFYTPQEKGEHFYVKELGGEALVEHYEFMKQLPNMGEILKELIDAGLELPTFQIFHIVYFKFGYVMFITYEEVPEAHDIFKRFGQVFEQTYTRFLDLERAEAQAREAQIEMALEKVRSRTMAMQHSDELKDAAQVLFNEVQNLGIPSWSCGYNILSDDKTSAECYMSSEGALQKPFTLYYDQEKSFIEQYNFFKSKKTFLVQEQKGKDLEEAYAYMKTIPRIGEIITDLKEEGISLPKHQFNHLCKFNKGYLLFITYEQVPEAHDLFVRFTKVFEQTYTRFLDLKKAEAQAREAKIETALERVRSQSMSMQGSEELSTTAQVFHQQLQLLGIDSEFSYLWLPEEDEKHQVFWATWSQNHNNHNDYHTKKVRYPLDKSEPSIAACYAAWESEESVHVNAVKPEEVEDYFKTWSELLSGVDKFQPKLFQEGLYYIDAYMSYGCFGIMVKQSLSDNEKTILNRFSTEFQRTYTRFLDLQKAEAQAREAQIEAALERVRSQSMGMQSTADFAEVTTEMFNQLRNFGEDLFATGIVFCDKHDGHVEQWHSIPGGGMLSPMIVPIDLDYIHQYRYDQWKAGTTLFSIEIPSNFIEQHFEAIFKLPSAQITLKDLESRNAPMPATPSWEIDYGASFKHGYILASSLKPLENMDILPRFAKVFEQAYTRYLDLQTAEKNAYKSKVEVALERVRAKALAMQEPEELKEVANVLRTEMGLLGIEELETSSIYILDNQADVAECWYALKDSGSKNKKLISDHLSMDFKQTWVGRQMLKFHESNKETTSIVMQGKQRLEWIRYCETKSEVLKGFYGEEIPDRTYHLHKFSHGAIGAASAGDISPESWVLLKRCAAVFTLAYSRFKDLSQARIDLKKLKAAKKRAETALAELQSTQKQLIQSEKMASLGELTAGIAHEIQNPLNFVNNFSEVSKELLDEMLEEIENGDMDEVRAIMSDVIQNLEKINHHGKRADGIVKGMLQHSRASGDKKEATDINALADEYLRLAYHGLRAKDKSFNSQLVTDFDEGIGKVAVVPQDIGRVVLNLLTNAFYAVHEKSKENLKNFEPTVSIKTKKTQDSFLLEVKDNGNGMPDSVKDKIFQPFFTTKPTGEGTGLGLSMSYDIVKAHNGTLKVNTETGEYTEFTIRLPLTAYLDH